VTFTTDGHGGTHLDSHSNNKLTGTGLSSGASYQGSAQLKLQINSSSGLASTSNTVFDITMASQGGAPGFVLRSMLHVTVDANGNVTASVDNFTVICQ
jgi:hypothetical protein